MKFEFSDLYKFYVSLGVVLIAISAIIPWLFLREPFDLFKTKEEISTLTPVAQATISKRQRIAKVVIFTVPIFSIAGMSLGVILGRFGLRKWYVNQQLVDERTRIDVELAKLSLRDATPDEIETRRAVEAAESLHQDQIEEINEVVYLLDVTGEALKVEQKIAQRMTEIFDETYEILIGKIVGGAYLDITLRGKSPFTKDYIVEIKYIKKGFNYGWLKEVALKLRHVATLYAQFEGRIPNTLLLIVANQSVWASPNYQTYPDKLSEDLPRRRAKHRVVYLTTEEIQD